MARALPDNQAAELEGLVLTSFRPLVAGFKLRSSLPGISGDNFHAMVGVEQTSLPHRDTFLDCHTPVCVMALLKTSLTTLESLVRPPCSRCGAKTWITRIAPSGEPGSEFLTFECPVCEISETRVSKSS
jgi:hypothetical protein